MINSDKSKICFCVGSITEKIVRQAGYNNTISAGGTVNALKNIILNSDQIDKKKSIAYFCGDNISSNLDHELKQEGLQIDKIINYTSEKITDLNEENNKIIKNHPPDIIFIYSKRSAESFVEIVKKYALNGLMTESRVLCISEKVLSVLKNAGWKKLEVFEPGEELMKLKYNKMEVLQNFKSLFFDVWKKGISGVNISEIIIALLIFLFFLFLRGVFSKFVVKRLENYVSKTTNNFDNSLVFSMEGPAKFFPVVLGFFVSTSYLTVETQAAEFLETINRSLITVLIFWTFHQIIGPLSAVIKSVGGLLSKDLINWIIKAIKVLIFILGLAAVLELWGIKIGPIIAGLGLFGVAVALGAQDLFKNLISGILVLVERRFQVGDWIYVEGVIEGTVESIGFRSTVVRRFDKSQATIPNFQFAENAVINNTQTTNRRINWMIGLEYKLQ